MNLDRKTTEEQIPKDEVGLEVVRKKREHPVHEMRWLLVSSQQKIYKSFESLIIVESRAL